MHQNRGSPMIAHSVAGLLGELGVGTVWQTCQGAMDRHYAAHPARYVRASPRVALTDAGTGEQEKLG